MRVYARRTHNYTDRERHVEYFFPERDWVDVPDHVGRLVIGVHPDKLVDISSAEDPDEAVEALNKELLEVSEPAAEESPEPEPEAKPAPQRRSPRRRTTPLGSRG